MKNIHKPIIDFMYQYAEKINDKGALTLIKRLSIDSESEAKNMLTFLELMCSHVLEDSKDNVVILNQPVCTSDLEKVCDVIEDHIEDIGYEHLID